MAAESDQRKGRISPASGSKIKDLKGAISLRWPFVQNMQDEKYWDRRSKDCRFQIPFEVATLAEHGITPETTILDAGCSYGRTLKCLAEHGFHNIHGLDYSEGMIQRARGVCPEARYIVASATQIPFPDGAFDAIISLGLVNHLVDDADLVRCLAEFHRVLKPGGICLITDYSYGTSDFDVERYLEFLPRYGYYGMIEVEGRKFHHRSHEMLVSMSAQKFEFVDVAHYPLPTERGHKRECYQLIMRRKR